MTGRFAIIFTDPDSRLHRREADTMPHLLDIHRHGSGFTEDAAIRVHREAHGLVPADIIEGQEGVVATCRP